MNEGGKGSRPRPFSIPKDQFDNNWDAIFRKKEPEPVDHNPTEDENGSEPTN
jgi:hypothetical protein